MDKTTDTGGENLLKTDVTRRGTLTAAAWAAPVIAVAAATPAAVASPLNPTTDLEVGATGGSEGFYSTGGNANLSQNTPNNTQNFRRGFWVQNKASSTASFTGTLRIAFKIPRMWSWRWGGNTGGDFQAFNNWSTQDLGGDNGGSVGGATGWSRTDGIWVQNSAPSGTNVWQAIWFRMDDVYFDLTNVNLPPGGRIWFAVNAEIPSAWINATGNNDGGTYIWVNPSTQGQEPSSNGGANFNGFIYWKSDLSIAATTTGGTYLGTWNTPVGTWGNAIWYFNGGGPYNYLGTVGGLYPSYGVG